MAFDTELRDALIDTVRRFVHEQCVPLEAQVGDEDRVPDEIVSSMKSLGLFGLAVPEAYGGLGLDMETECLVAMELGHTSPAFRSVVGTNVGIGSQALVLFGTDAQKDRYLPGIASGDLIASFALTEPEAGSDAGSLRTRAIRDGDHYVLNGAKQFISGAGSNEVYVAMVRTGEDGPKGITCMVIEKDFEGVSFGANEKKLGWHSQPTAQLILEDVRVPVENVVGGEGEGFRIAMMGLDGGRLNIGACSIGGAQRCLDEAITYTKDRTQFGKAVAEFQNTQFTLADMATDLEAARALLYLAAAKVTDNAPDKTRFSAMAKRLATDNGSAIVDRALQLHGGYGYLQDYPIERFWRDLRVHSILEGTNQIMRMVVGRDLLRQ